MAKYMMVVSTSISGGSKNNLVITADDVNFVSFPTDSDNPNYSEFLAQTGLTDKEIQALPAGSWNEAVKN